MRNICDYSLPRWMPDMLFLRRKEPCTHIRTPLRLFLVLCKKHRVRHQQCTLARTGSLLLDIRRLSCDQPRADTVSSIACVGRGVGRTRFRSRLGLAHLERKGEKPQSVVVLKYFALFNVLHPYGILFEAACTMSDRNGCSDTQRPTRRARQKHSLAHLYGHGSSRVQSVLTRTLEPASGSVRAKKSLVVITVRRCQSWCPRQQRKCTRAVFLMACSPGVAG